MCKAIDEYTSLPKLDMDRIKAKAVQSNLTVEEITDALDKLKDKCPDTIKIE